MTVARAIEQFLPGHPICYLGDIARTPYGTKSARTITDYSIENTQFLINQGAELVVIACNSASSVATDQLRQMFHIPIIEVISPAIQQALKETRSGRIGVIGTRATIRSNIYERQILSKKPRSKVFSKACPLLVPLVEEGWLNKRETKMILRRYLHGLKDKQIDTLVLGCTHYPLLKHLIQPRIGKKITLIDSSIATAQYLKSSFEKEKHLRVEQDSATKKEKSTFFVTDLTQSVQQVAEKIFQRSLKLERI